MAQPGRAAVSSVALSDYEPISCIAHERLEFAVLKKQWLEVEVLKGKWAGHHRLLPIDVYARDGVEWLLAENEIKERLTLRLDWFRLAST